MHDHDAAVRRQEIREEIERMLMIDAGQHLIDHDYLSKLRDLFNEQDQAERDDQADGRRVRRRAFWAVVTAALAGTGGGALAVDWENVPKAIALLFGG